MTILIIQKICHDNKKRIFAIKVNFISNFINKFIVLIFKTY